MQFVIHGSKPLTSPFISAVNDGEIPFTVFVHTDNKELVDDGLIHVYYEAPSNIGFDVFVVEYSERAHGFGRQRHSRHANQTRPDFLFIREGKIFEEVIKLTAFLDSQFYKLKDVDEEELILSASDAKTDPFTKFTSEIGRKIAGPLEQYLREMLTSMRVSEEHIGHVLLYSNIFHVALVDQDMNSDPLANYELLEFIGDLAAWKPLNDIFLEYAERKNIPMTEQVITAMHRSFASKEKQSQIARKLYLNVYLKKKGEVTIDTYEDIFESFVGAMFLTNFHIRAFLGVDLNLHETFLRWVYNAWDLSGFQEKPHITKFYEYMRVLAGKSVFRERIIGDHWMMYEEKGTKELIMSRLLDQLRPFGELKELKGERIPEFVERLFALIHHRYPNDMNSYKVRDEKYDEINRLVEGFISVPRIHLMTNERNMSDWDDDVKALFMESVDITKSIVSQRFVDKSRSSSYWIVQGEKDEIIYSTMDYDDSDNPETLIDIIQKQNAGQKPEPNMEVKRVPYVIGNPFYLELKSEEKFFLTGTISAIIAHVVDVYEKKTGQFYLVLSGFAEKLIPLEYDPRPLSYIHDEEKDSLEDVKQMLQENNVVYKPELSDALHRYVGDRAAYGYTALIAVFHHRITNVHHLTDVRNFYRSKVLKRELTRLLDVRDEMTSELKEFDQLIGRKMSLAEQAIMCIYLKIGINPRVIYRPESRIKSIRTALYARADAITHHAANLGKTISKTVEASAEQAGQEVRIATGAAAAAASGPPQATNRKAPSNTRVVPNTQTNADKILERERKKKSEIRTVVDKTKSQFNVNFVYETSGGQQLSLPICGFDNERVKGIFADWLLQYERQQNPNIDVLRNFRFASLPEFDTLRQAMEFRNVDEWQLFRNKRGALELRYFTTGAERVVYVSGSDIESITRRL